MICIYVLEDFTLGVQGQLDTYTPGGVGPTAESMFMGQRYDMGIICVTHTLSGTSQIIRENAETVIAFGLPGENPRLICDTFGATFEQAERIKTLRPGEFVILNPALWDKCVYATFEKPEISGRLDEATRRSAVQEFLKHIKAFPPAPFDAFKKKIPSDAVTENNFISSALSILTSDHIQMLVLIASGIPKPATKLYQQMGLNRTQGRRLAKKLESIGAITPHTYSTGKVGGHLCFFEVTDYGWRILQQKGIFKPKPKTNGGFDHELAVCLIEVSEKRQGNTVRFEVDLFGKRLDIDSFERKTSRRRFYNVGMSDVARESANIIEIMKIPVVRDNEFIFVARDTKFAREVQRILKDKDPTGNILRQVEIKTIADFVDV